MSSETDLSRNQGIQNLRNSFLRGFPLPFNVETLQAFGALFQIPHYYRKFLHCRLKMLCNNLNKLQIFVNVYNKRKKKEVSWDEMEKENEKWEQEETWILTESKLVLKNKNISSI
jgi:hypothetical protein